MSWGMLNSMYHSPSYGDGGVDVVSVERDMVDQRFAVIRIPTALPVERIRKIAEIVFAPFIQEHKPKFQIQ